MVKINLSDTHIEVIGHGNNETCSRVSQLLNDIVLLYSLTNVELYKKYVHNNKIIFDNGYTLITWDDTLNQKTKTFITYSLLELKRLYPNTIELN